MSTGIIRRLDRHGDTKVAEWDTGNPASVALAERVFNVEAARPGSLMARCDAGTDLSGEKITKFDPSAQDIIILGQQEGG